MILWTVQAANQSKEAGREAQDVNLPSTVQLLNIRANGTIIFDRAEVSKGELEDRLGNSDFTSSKKLVLIVVDDPWSEETNQSYQETLRILRDGRISYSLFSH